MKDFDPIIEFLNKILQEKQDKLKWLQDSGRRDEYTDTLYLCCDRLEDAIDFLENAPIEIEELESKVEKLKHYEDIVKTIAILAKDVK